jgi:hypothetical protein
MKPLFRIPSKIGFLSDLFRQIRENIQERTIIESNDLRIIESTAGVKLEIKDRSGGVASATASAAAHPFQVYSPDTGTLTALGLDSTNAWRKFFVRCGRVNEFKVIDGTDRSDYPDDGLPPKIADFPFGHNFNDILITVPASTAKFYVWLEIVPAYDDTISGVYVYYGTNPVAEGWLNWDVRGNFSSPFNDTGQYFMMIAEITTTASAAKIRQLVRADVQKSAGSMFALAEYAVCIDGQLWYTIFPTIGPTNTKILP